MRYLMAPRTLSFLTFLTIPFFFSAVVATTTTSAAPSAPTYVVLDNYTVANFFNNFTFYTVSFGFGVEFRRHLRAIEL